MNKPIRRPRIGVTGPDRGGWPAWIFTALAVTLQGGRAVRIRPGRPRGLDELHGLILGGGADVDPARYREPVFTTLRQASRRRVGLKFFMSVFVWLARRVFSLPSSSGARDPARDELEFTLLGLALARNLPILGICRGGQLINVHHGGTLYQDLSEFYVERPNLRTVRARKPVHVEPGTTLSRLVGRRTLRVNSLHNQSVKTVGEGLRRAAIEPNGVIQAIEHQDRPFVLGLQWHPEFLPLHREQRRIFRYLIEAARLQAFTAAEVCPFDAGISHPKRP